MVLVFWAARYECPFHLLAIGIYIYIYKIMFSAYEIGSNIEGKTQLEEVQ